MLGGGRAKSAIFIPIRGLICKVRSSISPVNFTCMPANEQPKNEAEVSQRGAWHGALVVMSVTVHVCRRSSAALLLQRRCCCTAALLRCCSALSGSHRGPAKHRMRRAHCNPDLVVPHFCHRDRFDVRASSSLTYSFIAERLLLLGNIYTCALSTPHQHA